MIKWNIYPINARLLENCYELKSLDLDNETITLRRVNKKSLLNIPRILTDTKLPTDAQRELENFFEHIIKKYGLDGGFTN